MSGNSTDKNSEIKDPQEKMVETCKGCNKAFESNAIMKHIGHSKKCKAAYGLEYDALRKKKSKEKNQLYYTKNKGKLSLHKAQHYKKHAKVIKARVAIYQKTNPAKVKKSLEKYRKANAEEIKLKKAEYNKTKRNEICLKQQQRRNLSKDKWTAKDRNRAFKNDIKDGPTHVCMSCRRSLFLKGVKIIEGKWKENLETKVTVEFINSEILQPIDRNSSIYKFCHQCLSYIKQKKVPKLHLSNGLELDDVPECLELTDLEQQMIAKSNIFMKVKKLPRSGMPAISDKVINVPLEDGDIENTVTSLPRPPNKAGVIGVRLKRKKEFKSVYLEQYVRPHKVIEALEYLKDSGNPFYHNININRDFMANNESESDSSEEDQSGNEEESEVEVEGEDEDDDNVKVEAKESIENHEYDECKNKQRISSKLFYVLADYQAYLDASDEEEEMNAKELFAWSLAQYLTATSISVQDVRNFNPDTKEQFKEKLSKSVDEKLSKLFEGLDVKE